MTLKDYATVAYNNPLTKTYYAIIAGGISAFGLGASNIIEQSGTNTALILGGAIATITGTVMSLANECSYDNYRGFIRAKEHLKKMQDSIQKKGFHPHFINNYKRKNYWDKMPTRLAIKEAGLESMFSSQINATN